MQEVDEIISFLESHASEKNRAGMQRFGIYIENAYGVSMPVLRKLAKDKRFRKNHPLALELWKTGKHEARIMAGFIADPKLVTSDLMEEWVRDFNSWDICDQLVGSLFKYTPFAFEKALAWADDEEEFVRRAGFVIMAVHGLVGMQLEKHQYEAFWALIIKHADDNRNFVKKAINWAIRQLGKKNADLNTQALAVCTILMKMDSKSARWIASDAIRELNSDFVKGKITK